MHNSQMHKPDFRAVVVKHGHRHLPGHIDGNFLHQFTPHGFIITNAAGKQPIVLFGNVSSNANRKQPVQPGFLASFAAAITQDLVTANDERVRNKLLVTFVLFRLAPVPVKDI